MTAADAGPILRVATRNSPLALWQTQHVIDLLQAEDPNLSVEVVSMATAADKSLETTISALGGKGAFSKEVQQLVQVDQADIAVHSAKDLQADTPEGLMVGAYPERGDARDLLVGSTLAELSPGAVVATGSNRRRVQLAELRPDLQFAELRGNMGTRLSRLGEFDAIVTAVAALERLDLQPDVAEALEPEVMLPQVGQGALAVECRSSDTDTLERLTAIDHQLTRSLVEAERDFLAELGGDCDLPAGAHARLLGDQLTVVGMLAGVVRADGSVPVHRASVHGLIDDHPGRSVAQQLKGRL